MYDELVLRNSCVRLELFVEYRLYITGKGILSEIRTTNFSTDLQYQILPESNNTLLRENRRTERQTDRHNFDREFILCNLCKECRKVAWRSYSVFKMTGKNFLTKSCNSKSI
jgi:hypothetical protein